jgi:RNA polymerase sigma-70 factor, ECF subfamily
MERYCTAEMLGSSTSKSAVAVAPVVASAADQSRDDVELVSAFLAGESWAARAIWTRHAPMVFRLLERALGPNGDADDVTQEVFLNTFTRLPTLRDRHALQSFIYSVAVRTLKWELRRRKVRRILQLSPTGRVPDLPVRAADSESRQILERFYLLLDRLGANERSAFVLRYMEGLKLEEVAGRMGVSLATAKRWVSRSSTSVSALVAADRDLANYAHDLGLDKGARDEPG